MSSKKQARSSRSWRKLLRAKTNLETSGYELEIEEFVRKELQLKGKQRTTNVWMDYVREQAIIEEKKEKITQKRRTMETSKQAQDDWNSAMDFDESLNLLTPKPEHPKASRCKSRSRSSTEMKVQSSPLKRHSRATVISRADESGHFPPKNSNSPWPVVAASQVKGKGSFRLIDQTSYTFPYWANETSLPPTSVECRNKIIERRRDASGMKLRPPSASIEKARKEVEQKINKKQSKLHNAMYIDPRNTTALQNTAAKIAEADLELNETLPVDAPSAANTHEEASVFPNNSVMALYTLASPCAVEEIEGENERVQSGWVAFMEKQKRLRRERYLEDGAGVYFEFFLFFLFLCVHLHACKSHKLILFSLSLKKKTNYPYLSHHRSTPSFGIDSWKTCRQQRFCSNGTIKKKGTPIRG